MVQLIHFQLVERLVGSVETVLFALHSPDAQEALLAIELIHVQNIKLLEVALLEPVLVNAQVLHSLLNFLAHFLQFHRQGVLGIHDLNASLGNIFIFLIDCFLLGVHQFHYELVFEELPLDVIGLPLGIQFLQLVKIEFAAILHVVVEQLECFIVQLILEIQLNPRQPVSRYFECSFFPLLMVQRVQISESLMEIDIKALVNVHLAKDLEA